MYDPFNHPSNPEIRHISLFTLHNWALREAMLNVWLQRRTVKHRATNQAAVFEALGYISSLCPTCVLKKCTVYDRPVKEIMKIYVWKEKPVPGQQPSPFELHAYASTWHRLYNLGINYWVKNTVCKFPTLWNARSQLSLVCFHPLNRMVIQNSVLFLVPYARGGP